MRRAPWPLERTTSRWQTKDGETRRRAFHEGEFPSRPEKTPPSLRRVSWLWEPPARRVRPSSHRVRRNLPSLTEWRISVLSLPVYRPRWRPWTPLRTALAALAFGVAMGVLVTLTYRVRPSLERIVLAMPSIPRAVSAEVEEVLAVPRKLKRRADAALARDNWSPGCRGSPECPAGICIRGWGIRPSNPLSWQYGPRRGKYCQYCAQRRSRADQPRRRLGTVRRSVRKSGCAPGAAQQGPDDRGEARARACEAASNSVFPAWSAGYGAVLRILEQPALANKVNAVILLDGIHVGYQPDSNQLLLIRLAPFERFAKRAASGETLFTITHSNIVPMGNYAGTRQTTDALLRALNLERRGGEAA